MNTSESELSPLLPADTAVRWSATLAFALLVAMVAGALHFYKLGAWPWDVDEIPALYELGQVPAEDQLLLIPESQVERLPRLIPVWYSTQQFLLQFLSVNEWTTRLLSATCGVLGITLAVAFGYRRQGLAFAGALALVVLGSMCLVWLSQQNRFYTMTLLWYTATVVAVLARGNNIVLFCASVIAAALAVLSHNLLVMLFGVGWIAVAIGFMLGWAPRQVLIRASAVVATGSAIYFFYLRPLLEGWQSGGLGANPLLSFAAHAGLPTLAFAMLGTALSLARSEDRPVFGTWAIYFVGSMAVLVVLPWLPIRWYARYHIFLLGPTWVMAALAVDRVAKSIEPRLARVAWYAMVGVLLLPSLASHYRDGTRHDMRFAAEIVAREAKSGQPILSDSADILAYYLPDELRKQTDYYRGPERLPPKEVEFLLVRTSNVWTPVVEFADRRIEVIAEKAKRRFDGLSYRTRVYRVSSQPATRE